MVKGLDAFPKVPDSYVETTASGGTGKTNPICVDTFEALMVLLSLACLILLSVQCL